MRLRPMILLSLAVVAGMTALALFAVRWAPQGMQLPIHWNAAGGVDRTAPVLKAALVPVFTVALCSALLAAVPLIEPLQHRPDRSATFYRTAWGGLLVFMLFLQGLIVAPVFGLHPPAGAHLAGVGLLFLLLGNALPKTRPGFFVGIRTPWTLTDPENWVATHRLGGRTMMLGGGLILIACFLPAGGRVWLFRGALGVAILPPLLYSYLFWRGRQRDRA